MILKIKEEERCLRGEMGYGWLRYDVIGKGKAGIGKGKVEMGDWRLR